MTGADMFALMTAALIGQPVEALPGPVGTIYRPLFEADPGQEGARTTQEPFSGVGRCPGIDRGEKTAPKPARRACRRIRQEPQRIAAQGSQGHAVSAPLKEPAFGGTDEA